MNSEDILCCKTGIGRPFCLVQSLSHVWFFVTPWTAAGQASLSLTISCSLLKLKSIDSVMPSNHLILCGPLLLLPSIFRSKRVFSSESALHIRWPKYWSFSFSISPSSEYSGLISFRSDWFNLHAVQGTLKSLLSTTVWKHPFFSIKPSLWSNSHTCTWLLEKTVALTRWTSVGKEMSLLFNTLSRFVITFLPRRKCFNFRAAVTVNSDFGAQENSLSLFTLFPHLFAMKWWDWMPWSLFFECWVLSQLFHSHLSPSSRGSLFPLCSLPKGWCHLHIWGYWYFSQQSWFQLVLNRAQHFVWCTLHVRRRQW